MLVRCLYFSIKKDIKYKKFYFSGLQTYKSSRRPTLAILINSFILDAGVLGFVLSLASMIHKKKKKRLVIKMCLLLEEKKGWDLQELGST